VHEYNFGLRPAGRMDGVSVNMEGY